MSPAWRMMLFVASPLSISSFKLTVIVLFKGGGSTGAGEFAEVLETAVVEEGGSCAGPVWVDPLETVAGAQASRPLAGGSPASDGAFCACRLPFTLLLALAYSPP